MAKLIGVVVKDGQKRITKVLQQMLEGEPNLPIESPPPQAVKVPEALSHYHVEAPSAAIYDHLLLEVGHE